MESLNRWQYAFAVIGITFLRLALDPVNQALDDATFYTHAEISVSMILSVGQVAVIIWLTAMRCIDIGISKWHSLWSIIPFAVFYFMCRRGDAYYRADEDRFTAYLERRDNDGR